MAKVLMYGNEAIAYGARDAGCRLAAGYPGTPSTEIIETLARFDGVHVEWSTNEKVALEVAIGASIAGQRAMACMKHVGLNVASDPLMTASYMGVGGGLVVVSADDPGMHSSQNEQDNRWYGRFAGIPVLEPSDSQEAYIYTREAFRLSEMFDTPVILRSTTRISHARSLVALGEPEAVPDKPYRKDPVKYVMLPAHARRRKPVVLERLNKIREYAEQSPLNRVEWGDTELGFVTGGIAYQYVKEAFPQASVLKLGLSYPLPVEMIKDFSSKVDHLFVVEELDNFWETLIRAMGIDCRGKDVLPAAGELSPSIVRHAVAQVLPHRAAIVKDNGSLTYDPPLDALPVRSPVLCPGCPHRGVFYVLKKLNLTVAGDIGCYTLGALPPLSSLDTTTCMGSGIGHSQGMRIGLPLEQAERVVAVIGDSTFLHSGIPPLLNMTYNRVHAPVIVLDNGTTAMTGHQGHPGSGWDARRRQAPRILIEDIARACGVSNVVVVNAYDLGQVEEAVRKALQEPSSVIIARTQCALLAPRKAPVSLDGNRCVGCMLCHRLGCPALERDGRRPRVNPDLCTGCGVCTQVCPRGALLSELERGDER